MLLTAPIAVHVAPPSLEYCQAPLPLASALIAMPCSAPLSRSLIEAPTTAATVWPALAVWSSVIEFKVGAAGVSTGASFTGLTVIELLNAAPLKAVLPPLLLVSAVPPAVPLVWSQARQIRPLVTLPFQLAFGTKRTQVLASDASKRAVLAPGVPKAVQLAPASVEYCQAPLLLSTAVTAMPLSAPLSTSLTCPAINADTSVPGLLAAPSLIGARLFAPFSTGASLTAATEMLRVPVLLFATPSLTTKATVRVTVLGLSLLLR